MTKEEIEILQALRKLYNFDIDLLSQGALDGKDRELKEEADRQQLALATVHDFLVNNVYN